MKHVRSISLGATAVVAAGAAVASGAVGSVSEPPATSLAQALHAAFAAPKVEGVTARIAFTNKLVDSSGLAQASGVGGSPLLVGAKGRLWLAADGRARIELQSDRGDAQIVSDGKKITVYDASSNTAYVATLPQDSPAHADDAGKPGAPHATTPPSVAKISEVLAKVAKVADLGQPDPTTLAGRGAYSVQLAARNGGLVGKAELAWDAATGVPLRLGVYATGASKPTLEVAATDISFGPVDASAVSVPVPAGAKVETIDLPSHADEHKTSFSPAKRAELKAEFKRRAALTPAQVAAALPFKLSAPATLAGQSRTAVRLVGSSAKAGALVTYGTGLGGIAVLQTAASQTKTTAPSKSGDPASPLAGATPTINGAKGTELATALGTLVRFQRGGVQYTVAGSVTSAVAEAAARGL